MEALIRYHHQSALHRDLIQQVKQCGCFHCLSVFPVEDIKKWVDQGQTALCPTCGVDAVLPQNQGQAIESQMDTLKTMKHFWFSGNFN